jgi:hypothetical protein
MAADQEELVEAIRDLTRVMLALHGDFPSTAEAVRRLTAMSIPPSRVAVLLGMKVKDVTTYTARERKKLGAGSPKNGKR